MSDQIIQILRQFLSELEEGRQWEVSAEEAATFQHVALQEIFREAFEHADEPLHLLDMAAWIQSREDVPAAFKTALVLYARGRVALALGADPEGEAEEDRPDWYGYEPEEVQGGPEDFLEDLMELEEEEGSTGFEFPLESVSFVRQQAYSTDERTWREAGILSLSGYRVGKTRGLPTHERRRILNWLVLKDDLSDVQDRAYAAEWGSPRTSQRLRKIVNSIAAFVRDRKQDHRDFSMAIEHWEADLHYLRSSFYDPWGVSWWWPSL